jgi:hypothetical protein
MGSSVLTFVDDLFEIALFALDYRIGSTGLFQDLPSAFGTDQMI